MNLTLEKNDNLGVYRDDQGIVRGLWFADRWKASDPEQCLACCHILQARGERFEDRDVLVYSLARIGKLNLTEEPRDGGYARIFASVEEGKSKRQEKSGCVSVLVAGLFLTVGVLSLFFIAGCAFNKRAGATIQRPDRPNADRALVYFYRPPGERMGYDSTYFVTVFQKKLWICSTEDNPGLHSRPRFILLPRPARFL